ncbi:MAG: RelA/SpoT family protein [Geitlerinemataceae cyanobacterium]
MIAVASFPADRSFDNSLEIPDWLRVCLGQLSAPELVQTLSPEERGLIAKAFTFAYDLHSEQCRKSGEPYIVHPIEVAGLLRELGGDGAAIAAGFLHDIVEDTSITADDIEADFGAEIRGLVEGVTKLSKFQFSSKTEHQAENFRRMFLAMAKDIRVIVVKLADRLHNMRTLEHLAPEKQKRIARETLDIFAPLANRLGIGRIKWELEDLSFKYLKPKAFREIRDLIADKRADREARLEVVISTISERLEQLGIQSFEVSGRPKHLHGIYSKMQKQKKEFSEIYDIAAVRIIVEKQSECYSALSVVHDAFRPIPGRFKDYIGLPKPNRYQSLHTGVMGRQSQRPIEVQIRTYEMHEVAEYGIAAHWKYKESGGSTAQMSDDDAKFTWLRQLLDWQSDLKADAKEYMEGVKANLFDDDVFVFTPDSDVLALKHGATPIDFAYRIHTEVGNHCAGAKVNGRMVTLDTVLENGDIVEIVTQKNSHPSLDWLNFTVTHSAQTRIRNWFKKYHRDENIARGREMLEKELGKKGFEALLKSEPMQMVAERCNYHCVDDLLAGVGYGYITLNQVVNRLRVAVQSLQPKEEPRSDSTLADELTSRMKSTMQVQAGEAKSNAPICGIEGILHHIAGCCTPIPGEPIVGVVTRDRGISIHGQGCPNTSSIPIERMIPVSWNSNVATDSKRAQTYPVDVSIEAIDRVGVLNDILTRLKDYGINVHSARVRTDAGKPATIDLGIGVHDLDQLDRTFARIRKMGDVLHLRRVFHG